MATQLQLRRGTTSETGSFTGAVGEVTVDTTKDTLVVHDGSTAGGFEMAKADGSNIEKLTKSGATKIATTATGISVTGDISNASGDLTLDVAGNIHLDSGSGEIRFYDGGTYFGKIRENSGNLEIISGQTDKDMSFIGNDNGNNITALTLDMSAAGAATFNSSVTATGLISSSLLNSANNSLTILGGGSATNNGANLTMYGGSASSSAGDFRFRNGTTETARITAAGAATFNTSVLLSGTGGLTTTGGNNLTVSGSVADHAGLVFATHCILPAEAGALSSGNIINLGQNGNEFKSLYLNTSIINDSGFTIDSGGATALSISSSQDVSIPSGKLGVNMSASSNALEVKATGNDNGIRLTGSSNDTIAWLHQQSTDAATLRMYDGSNLNVVIASNANADSYFNTGGNLYVGTSTDGGDGISFRPRASGSNTTSQIRFNRADTAISGTALLFMNNTVGVGSISYTDTATAFNTSSDYRLKEDVQPVSGATDRLKELKPVNFAWKANGSRVDGFLAHEAQEVVPESVTGSKDAMMTEEYEVSPATGDIYTPEVVAVEGVEAVEYVAPVEAQEAVIGERQKMKTVETGTYVNLAGETITETQEIGVTEEQVQTVVERQDIDGVMTEVEVEKTVSVPVMESYEISPTVEAVEGIEAVEAVEAVEGVAEVIVSSNVERPSELEDGQLWRETTAQVMGEREVPDYQGIDQSKLVPLLVATIQELEARITALEA